MGTVAVYLTPNTVRIASSSLALGSSEKSVYKSAFDVKELEMAVESDECSPIIFVTVSVCRCEAVGETVARVIGRTKKVSVRPDIHLVDSVIETWEGEEKLDYHEDTSSLHPAKPSVS